MERKEMNEKKAMYVELVYFFRIPYTSEVGNDYIFGTPEKEGFSLRWDCTKSLGDYGFPVLAEDLTWKIYKEKVWIFVSVSARISLYVTDDGLDDLLEKLMKEKALSLVCKHTKFGEEARTVFFDEWHKLSENKKRLYTFRVTESVTRMVTVEGDNSQAAYDSLDEMLNRGEIDLFTTEDDDRHDRLIEHIS